MFIVEDSELWRHIKSFSLSSISVQEYCVPSSYDMWTILNYFMVKNIVICCAIIQVN